MTEVGLRCRLYQRKNAQKLGKNPAFSKLSLKFATQNDAGITGVRKREMHDSMCQKEPMALA